MKNFRLILIFIDFNFFRILKVIKAKMSDVLFHHPGPEKIIYFRQKNTIKKVKQYNFYRVSLVRK